MKLKLDEDSNNPELNQSESRSEIQLPQGLFGFAEIRKWSWFMIRKNFRLCGFVSKKGWLAFIVLEPGGIISDYSLEISDADVKLLDITGPEDTMILNIVTLPPDQSGKISLNLVGPIIVNRRTLVGKQCIINNHEEFSARHVLDVGGEGL